MTTNPNETDHGLIPRGAARQRRGLVLIWVSIIGLVLLLFVGLAIDTGFVYITRHELQNAADAAALAGAAKVKYDVNGAKTDAVNTAHANSAAHTLVQLDAANGDVLVGRYDKNTNTFTANSTPYNAVKVTARRTTGSPGGPINLFFGSIAGVSTSQVSRSAIAVTGGTIDAGLLLLGGGLTLNNHGNTGVVINNGAIQVNSAATPAVSAKGTAGSIVATELRVGGTIGMSGHPTVPKVSEHALPAVDPFASLPAPTKGSDLGTLSYNKKNTTDPATHLPGYYSGGISVNQGTVNLQPGTYILGPGGLSIGGNGILNAAGSTFYITKGNTGNSYGSVSISGKLNGAAPSSGTYKNIKFFVDRNAPSGTGVATGGNQTWSGVMYMPSIAIGLKGNEDFFGGTQVIAASLDMGGNPSFTVNYIPGTNPIEINNVFLVQ